MYAPIVLFAYNRPYHLKKTLDSLQQNDLASESILYVYADGPKNDCTPESKLKINQVREVLNEKWNFKEMHIVCRDTNIGLANNVITGVTEIVDCYGSVIVLEDDLLTSKFFLSYMNEAIEKYKLEEQVMQISGHQFPIKSMQQKNEALFLPFTTSWGWATWKRAWGKFDLEADGYEKLKTDSLLKRKFDLEDTYPYSNMLINQMETKTIDSWAIRWWWSVFKQHGLVLFPDKSLVKNIGFDNEGTHTKADNPFELKGFDSNYKITIFPKKINISKSLFENARQSIRVADGGKKIQSNKFLNNFLKCFLKK